MEKYVFHTTGDGSPTLSLGSDGEWMHHRAGAYSESHHVYGEALKVAWDRPSEPHIVCVGLGLGYLEFLTAAFALNLGKSCYLTSFESDSFLREQFERFVTGDRVEPAFERAYLAIEALVSSEFVLRPDAIRRCLSQWRQSDRWRLNPAFPDAPLNGRAHVVLYDAFSAKTHPRLWDESFLKEWLGAAAHADCLFATYASTAALNRALRAQGFVNQRRAGFSGKRERTLAVRGGISVALP